MQLLRHSLGHSPGRPPTEAKAGDGRALELSPQQIPQQQDVVPIHLQQQELARPREALTVATAAAARAGARTAALEEQLAATHVVLPGEDDEAMLDIDQTIRPLVVICSPVVVCALVGVALSRGQSMTIPH